jgi:4-hydroxy-tetrahydrodipicolinate synthase
MVAAAEAKTWARANLRGLLTSPLTIFRDNLDLDHEALEFNVEHILRVGVEGMGYGHGEPWSLSLAERKESTEHFLAAVGNRALRYVHTFSHSAPDTVDLTNHAAGHGADLVMIEAPYEHAKSDGQILRYFQYVAERTDLGIIVLNTPHSGRLLSTALLGELADIPAVCALKDGINDWTTVSLHVRAIGDRVVVSHPREEEALSSVMYLGQQVQLGTSAVFLLQTPGWTPVRQYFELARAGRVDDAFRVWSALGPLRNLWSEMHTSLWGPAPEHPIAKAKAWSEVMGMRGGAVRPPSIGIDAEERARYQAQIRETLAATQANPVFAEIGSLHPADSSGASLARVS